MNIHFLKDEKTLAVLQVILALAGPNYNIPYDITAQPSDGAGRNADPLLQYQLPGGSVMQGLTEPAASFSMGSAINSLMAGMAPFVSAYMMILPILGVIRGIIEVICALMNPFSVIRAVIKLFTKWIPPFLALMPPFAGLLMVLGIIKLILAIILFILTVVVPMVKLIYHNVKLLYDVITDYKNSNEQQINAARTKLLTLLIELLNQMGILSVLRPILEMIFMILKLKGGKPCKKKKKRKATDIEDEDVTCCDDNVCPPVLKDPPKGRAMLLPATYGDAPPAFTWKIVPITGNARMQEIVPFIQSVKPQLDSQLDEPINEAKSAGSAGNSAHFNIKLTKKRGNKASITVPIVKLNENTITIIDISAAALAGSCDYEIIPNWEPLIARNIIGLGCHPDIEDAKNELAEKYDNADSSVEEMYPYLAALETEHADATIALGDIMDDLCDEIVGEVFETPSISRPYTAGKIASVMPTVITTSPKQPPYNDDTFTDKFVSLLFGYKDALTGKLNRALYDATNAEESAFDVDKNVVHAGNLDMATIFVTPKDITGSDIAKNMPSDVNINIKLFCDFGIISDQVFDSSTGTVTANIKSLLPGTANITAKVNDNFIVTRDGGSLATKVVQVRFIADAVLPQRRTVSKFGADTVTHNTAGGSEKEPGVNNG